MMDKIHPLIDQLRFTRSEFKRALKGVTDDEASKRFLPINCIAWNVGHLAWQEQRYFLGFAQGKILYPEIEKAFAYGAPASTPALTEMLKSWSAITQATDVWLDAVTSDTLLQAVLRADGKPSQRFYGNLLQRLIYHYWYHTGENMAIRQQLGHTRLPEYVGNIDDKAPYRPE
jgi:uncharacterized damage-inducible protein DinB